MGEKNQKENTKISVHLTLKKCLEWTQRRYNSLSKFLKPIYNGYFVVRLLLWTIIVVFLIPSAVLIFSYIWKWILFRFGWKLDIDKIIIFTGSLGLFVVTVYGIYLREKQIKQLQKGNEDQSEQFEKQMREGQERDRKQQEQFNKQIESQRKTRLDDKFSKALELLGSDNLLKQKGGINLLKTLAIESPEHREECLYSLTDLNEWMKHIKEKNFFIIENQKVWYEKNLKERYYKIDGWKQIITIEEQELSRESLNSIESIIRRVVESSENDKDMIQKDVINFASKHLCGIKLNSVENSIIEYFDFNKANLQGADLSGAYLQGADLSDAKLEGADLSFANLQGADLSDANLQGADLMYAYLQGAYLRNTNLQGAYLSDAKLEGADLRDAKLEGADLRNTKLQGAYLRNANLQGAYLRNANLQGADLRDAKLEGADLRNANLQGANLKHANLQGAIITSTNLIGTDIAGITGYFLSDRNFTINDGWRRKTIQKIIKESIHEPTDKDLRERTEKKLKTAYNKYKKAKESGETIDLSNTIASDQKHYDSILNTWIDISKDNYPYVHERLLKNVIDGYNSLTTKNTQELKENIGKLGIRFYDDYIVETKIVIDDGTKKDIEEIRQELKESN